MAAAEISHLEIVQYLLRRGVDANGADEVKVFFAHANIDPT